MNHARDSARELMKLGQVLNDPRSAGLGLWTLTIIAILSDSNAEALQHSEQALATAVTPWDEDIAIGCKAAALVLLRHTEDGAKMIEEAYRRAAKGGLFSCAPSMPLLVYTGLCRARLELVSIFLNSQFRATRRRAIGTLPICPARS
jgi:hypothetical protein